MNNTRNFGLVFWIHALFILAIWSSPFWLSWKYIIIGVGLYYLQLLLLGDCVLTRFQFRTENREITFYSQMLEKIGFDFNRQHVRFVADYMMPWIIFMIALFYQTP